MSFTIAALKTELQSDPKNLGYAALIAVTDRIGLARLINSTYQGVGVVWRNDLKAAEVLAALVETEVSNLTTANWTRVQTLLMPLVIDAGQATIRAQFNGIFSGKTTTLANLTAVGQKANPSRAEELWGYQFAVTEQNIADAIG